MKNHGPLERSVNTKVGAYGIFFARIVSLCLLIINQKNGRNSSALFGQLDLLNHLLFGLESAQNIGN